MSDITYLMQTLTDKHLEEEKLKAKQDLANEIKKRLDKWIAQGRDPEHIYAVKNFFSGVGNLDDLLKE